MTVTHLSTYLALVAAARALEQLQSVRAADLANLEDMRSQNIRLTNENRALRDAIGGVVVGPRKDAK